MVLVGTAFREGFTPASYRNNKGSARAYDVRSGRKLWEFHTIPQKGEPGYETWLKGSAEYTGNTGVWTEISADPEAGPCLPAGRVADFGFLWRSRPGNGSVWQCPGGGRSEDRQDEMVLPDHPSRDLDYDLSSAPLLMDITVGGKPIKAVAVPTKQGYLYVFDRITGKPVWPIVERPVPKSDVPGEWYAPTQPFPTKPAPYAPHRRHAGRADRLHARDASSRRLSWSRITRSAPSSPRRSSASWRPLGTLMLGPPMAAPTGPAASSIRKTIPSMCTLQSVLRNVGSGTAAAGSSRNAVCGGRRERSPHMIGRRLWHKLRAAEAPLSTMEAARRPSRRR